MAPTPRPRFVHRLLALLTTLSTLHLMLVGGDIACAGQGSGPNASMTAMSATASSPGHVANGHEAGVAERSSASTESTNECATPTHIHCCVAMSDCSISATADVIERSGSVDVFRATPPEHANAMLASVPMPPEPPPPRA
jgi:hypothetical protein